MKLPMHELENQVRQARMIYHGVYLHHVKSDAYYVVVDLIYVESTMELMFVYHSLDYHSVRFARPMAELDDGRFTMSRSHPHD